VIQYDLFGDPIVQPLRRRSSADPAKREKANRIALGEAARDKAIDRVEAAAPEAWKSTARDIVRRLATTGDRFTADDVWAALKEAGAGSPPEPRALGAIVREFVRARLIAPAGWELSSRPECHRRPVRVWEGRRE